MRRPAVFLSIGLAMTSGLGGQATHDTLTVPKDSVDLVRRALPGLANTLRHLSTVEEGYRTHAGRYANDPGLLPLARASEPGIRFAILWADSTGWSAVAIHDSLPGAVCALSGGRLPSVIAADSATPGVLCRFQEDVVVYRDGGRQPAIVADTKTSEVQDQPQQTCPQHFVIPAEIRFIVNQSPPQTVVAQFMIDTLGHPEVPKLTITRSMSAAATVAALVFLDQCSYTPARINGRRVRWLVEQPVTIGRPLLGGLAPR